MFNMATVREYVGADVLSLLSVPVFIMEPMSMLQKMGDVLEYAELLDAADAAADPLERCECLRGWGLAVFRADGDRPERMPVYGFRRDGLHCLP
jgi:hypothetical protein